MKVAINGFGRIGKQFFMAALEHKVSWEFIINENADLDSIVYALKHDSVHPSLKDVTHDGTNIIVGKAFGKRKVKVIREMDATKLPWKKEKVSLVVDCTGLFTEKENAQKHLEAGARYVLISAPAKGNDLTFVHGVNNKMYKREHQIISAGSCTTNCAAVMIKILHDTFGIKSAYFVTTHAYTATQRLIDGYDKKDALRGRSAAHNIVPSTSGASQSVVESIPELAGKIEGYSLRVPVIDGSIVSVIAQVENPAEAALVNDTFKRLSAGVYKGVLDYSEEGLVSTDIIHNSASCVFDASLTSTLENTISIAGWYDNEWGYSNRLVDVAQSVIGK